MGKVVSFNCENGNFWEYIAVKRGACSGVNSVINHTYELPNAVKTTSIEGIINVKYAESDVYVQVPGHDGYWKTIHTVKNVSSGTPFDVSVSVNSKFVRFAPAGGDDGEAQMQHSSFTVHYSEELSEYTLPNSKNAQATAKDGSIDLEWEPWDTQGMLEGVTYKIYKNDTKIGEKRLSKDEQYMKEQKNERVHYTDNNVNKDKIYTYVILPYVGWFGNLDERSDVVSTIVKPSAPRNLRLSKTKNNISLSWDAPSEGDVKTYKIYHSKDGGRYKGITSTRSPAYIHRNVDIGTHRYYIIAHNKVGDSDKSNTESIKISPEVVESSDEVKSFKIGKMVSP